MVKVYVVPLESLQTNLLQQVLRKIPVRPLCRLRLTCKFLDSHMEENKNSFANRYFDQELDLLWSYSLSCPRLTLMRSYEGDFIDFTYKWGKYEETVTWDSLSAKWSGSHLPFEPEVAGKFSAIAFDSMSVCVNNLLDSSQIETLKNLNIYCQTLCIGNASADHLAAINDAVKCRAIYVDFYATEEDEDFEDMASQLAESELCSKIHVYVYSSTVPTICEWMRKFRGLTFSGSAQDFKDIIEDLYTTTDCKNLQFLRLRLNVEHIEQQLTLAIPHETIWDLHWVPVKYRKGCTPLSIHLVQLQGKQAVVSIYDYQEKMYGGTVSNKELHIDAIGENEQYLLTVVKKKLRIWDPRREDEYHSADANCRKQILRQQFVESRR